MTDGWTDTRRQLTFLLASVAQVKIGVGMNATDVTWPCAAMHCGLIMLTCGSRKMEFLHDRKPVGRNAELRTVQFSFVI